MQSFENVNFTNFEKSENSKNLNGFIYLVSCFAQKCKIEDKDKNLFLDIPQSYFLALLNDTKPLYEFLDKQGSKIHYFLVFEKQIFENLKKGVTNKKNATNGGINLPNSLW